MNRFWIFDGSTWLTTGFGFWIRATERQTDWAAGCCQKFSNNLLDFPTNHESQTPIEPRIR